MLKALTSKKDIIEFFNNFKLFTDISPYRYPCANVLILESKYLRIFKDLYTKQTAVTTTIKYYKLYINFSITYYNNAPSAPLA